MMIRHENFKDLQVEENVEFIVGRGSSFNGMRIHNDGKAKGAPPATVRIGRHFHSGKRCLIRTSDHDFSRGYPLVNGTIAGYKSEDVTIGDYVWLGDDVLIMKGVTIGDGAIIQARSVVVSDIPPLAIAGGHPCRAFSSRDPEEYQFLINLGLHRIERSELEGKRAFIDARLAEFRAGRVSAPASRNPSAAPTKPAGKSRPTPLVRWFQRLFAKSSPGAAPPRPDREKVRTRSGRKAPVQASSEAPDVLRKTGGKAKRKRAGSQGPKHWKFVVEPGKKYHFPDFFIAGVMKCGTSSLGRNLHRHPQIFLANEGGEVHYIDNPKNQKKGLDWYLAHFPERPGVLAYGDKTPAYMDVQNHALLRKTAPDAKVIVIFRDPVSRFQSHYNYAQRPGVPEIARSNHARPFRIEYLKEPWFDQRMLERGFYDIQMESLLAHYPGKQVLVCFLEDFRDNEQAEYDRIFSFLGVDSMPVESRRINEQASYPFPLDDEAKRELGRLYAPHNENLFRILDLPVRPGWGKYT